MQQEKTRSVPKLLNDVIEIVDDAVSRMNGDEIEILRGTVINIRELIEKLPLDLLPNSLEKGLQFLGKLENGEYDEFSTRYIHSEILNVRMSAVRALGFVTVGRREKISISQDYREAVNSGDFTYYSLSHLHRDDCMRIDDATNEHRWDEKTWKENMNQPLVNGKVLERNNRVVSYISYEIERVPPHNVRLLNAGVHPDVPEAGKILMNKFIDESSSNEFRMPLRERRKWLQDLLIDTEFKPHGLIRNFYRYVSQDLGDTYEDAVRMVRKKSISK